MFKVKQDRIKYTDVSKINKNYTDDMNNYMSAISSNVKRSK